MEVRRRTRGNRVVLHDLPEDEDKSSKSASSGDEENERNLSNDDGTDDDEDEGEEYAEEDQSRLDRSRLKRTRQVVAKTLEVDSKSPLLNVYSKKENITLDLVYKIQIPDLVSLLFELSGFPATLFDADEIKEHAPNILIDSCVSRCDEMNVAICPVSLLCLPLLRQLAKRRNADLEKLRQQSAMIKGLGLSSTTLNTTSTSKEYLELTESYNLVTKNTRLKVFDELRICIHNLILLMFTSSDDDEVLNTKLPFLISWLDVMCASTIRPIRHTGVYLLGCLAYALLARMSEMSSRFRVLLSQVSITQRIADLTASIKDTLRHCLSITAFLQGPFKDIICVRHKDVSWHVQYEILTLLNSLVEQCPYYWLFGSESLYTSFWIGLASHTNPEIRLLCFDSLKLVFNVLDSRFSKEETTDAAFNYVIPDEAPYKIIQAATAAEIKVLDTFKPPGQSIGYRTQEFMHRVFAKVLLHIRDSDLRVSTTAANCLAVMGRFENTWGNKYSLALSDESVTRAVSLLFSAESLLAKIEVARFVDTAIFQSSIINEAEVKQILNYSTQAALPSLTAERVMSMSVELNTFVEFLRDFANTPTWQARHIQAIEAFWILSPFLHFWDLLLDHLCVAFNQTAVISEDSRRSIAASWVRSESIESLFSLLLGLIEIERASLGCQSRYYTLPDFKTLQSQPSEQDCFKTLGDIACTGFRLPSSDTDDLWKFKVDLNDAVSCHKIRRLALRFRHVWRLAKHMIEGSKSSSTLYMTCLCILYELVTGTDALIFTNAYGLAETELDLKAIETHTGAIIDVILGQLPQLQERKALQASYAIVHKIRSNLPSNENLTDPLATFVAARQDIAERISIFFMSYRAETLTLALTNAKELVALKRGSSDAPNCTAAYRSSVILLTALTENDVLNPFREGIETLDELIGVTELKVNLMNPQLNVKGSPMEPSDHLTTLTFELIWIALARWMEQIETRFVGSIVPSIEHFSGTKSDQADDLGSRAANFANDMNRVKALEDHLRILKEDLDIFKELLSQLLGFAAKYSEGLRGRLQRPAPELISTDTGSMYSGGEDTSKIEEERHLHRKCMLLAATCIIRLILNATFFHTLSRLWLMIEQGVTQLLEQGQILTEKLLQCARDIKELCQACRDPPRSESAHEVAFFLDQLRQLSIPHRRLMNKNRLESTFSLFELSYGVLSSFGSVSPSPTGALTMCDLYRDCTSEEAVLTTVQSLPGLAEMAYLCHIQLMATICQIPDPGLWKEASIGAVILTGLNSANLVLQTMARIFLDRLNLYDTTRLKEIEKLRLTVKTSGTLEDAFETNSEPTMLCQILCGVIAQLLDRIQNSKNRNLEEARLVAANAAQHLYPHYFINLSNEEFNKFTWHVIRLSWVEPATPKIDGIFLTLISQNLLKGRLLKRKWIPQEAAECLNQIRTNFNVYFEQLDTEKFSSLYFEALEKFLRICYPLARKQTISTQR